MHARVVRDAIELVDIRPHVPTSDGPFPGYYVVDPLNGYQMIDESSPRIEPEQGKNGAV